MTQTDAPGLVRARIDLDTRGGTSHLELVQLEDQSTPLCRIWRTDPQGRARRTDVRLRDLDELLAGLGELRAEAIARFGVGCTREAGSPKWGTWAPRTSDPSSPATAPRGQEGV